MKYISEKADLDAYKKTGKLDDDTLIAKRGGNAGKRIKNKDALIALIGNTQQSEQAAEEYDDKMITVPFVISDGSVDRDNDTVDPVGIDLVQYTKNPVILFGHDHSTPAIGKSIGTVLQGDVLTAVAQFTPRCMNEFGGMIGELVENGFMSAASIGFRPIDYVINTTREDQYGAGADFKLVELIEWSVVNVGSNRNALSQAKAFGIDMKPMLDLVTKTLDGEGKIAISRTELELIWRELKGETPFDMIHMIDAVKNEKTARIKAERELAKMTIKNKEPDPEPQPVDVIDWRAVAVQLADGNVEDFNLAVTANTFASTEQEAIEANAKSTDDALAALCESEKTDPSICDATTEELPLATPDQQPVETPAEDAVPQEIAEALKIFAANSRREIDTTGATPDKDAK